MSDQAGIDGSFRSDVDDAELLREGLSLVNEIDDGLYRLDAEGRFVAVNDAVVETTGYSRERLLDEHVSVVVADADAERLGAEIRTRLETGSDPETTFDLVIETADGDRVPCELRFSLLGANGEFEGTVGVVRTADEPGQHPEHLPSRWTTYDSIASVINEASVGVFVLDDAFDVVWIDETLEEYFGIDRSETIGRNKRTLIRERIRDRFADPDAFAETVLATYDDNTYVEQFTCQITAGPDREQRWLEHRSKPIESGRFSGGRIELYYDVSERKAAERARRESERRFESLVDAVDEYAIFMLDPEGTVVSWNEGAERIKGYSSAEIVGEHFSAFYTEADREAGVPERNLTQAREAGTVEKEGWRLRADGTRFWANVTITAVYDEGELQGFAKVTQDMTDRREREQQIRRERDLTAQILETVPVGIAVVNPDGTTARANERMGELLGVRADGESMYTTAQREMYDGDGDHLQPEERPVARVFETGEAIVDREVRLDGPNEVPQWVSITARPIACEDGVPNQVVETATDITDLKELAERRQRELEERERELEAIQLATRLLESSDETTDEFLRTFATTIPQFFRHPERTGVHLSVGGDAVTTDGYEATDRRITASTTTDNGTPVAIHAALQDGFEPSADDAFLEEERELLETLATLLRFHVDRNEYIADLRESNRRLEQFAYAASHDLQEPLRMVSSYLKLINRRYADDLDEDGEEFLEYAVGGADRMREMIDGLLEYSRVESKGDPFEPVDLDAVLEEVLDDLRLSIGEHDADITAGELPTVEGDVSQLRQVFQNLLDNAIEYSGEGTPHVEITAERVRDEWEIAVADDGIGIDADAEDRVFEVFQRLHTHEEHAGTGIGLALCRRIVERHGGEIWVESEPGEGSTFRFTLPAVDE